MQRYASRMASRREARGFTLIELLVVVLIVAILAAVALPSFNRQVQKTRRTDGHNILLRIAAEQERFFTNSNQYAATLNGAPPAGLGFTTLTSENGHYLVTAAMGAGNQTFTLTATAQGTQVNDACGNLTLGNSDAKGFSGTQANGKCW